MTKFIKMMSSNITFESGDETATVLTFETKFGKTKWIARKTNSFFITLLPFMSSGVAAVQS